MRAEEINTVEKYVEELKKGMNKVYINEWGTQMAGPKWPRPVFAFNTQVTRDAIKHFVDGIGDLNPIFRDREYAQKTKYSSLISPPTFLYTIGYGQYPDPPGFPPLKNFNNPYAGDEYEWFRPICEGDEIDWKTTFPIDIHVKQTRSGGTTAFLYGKHEYSNHHDGKAIATCRFCIALVKAWGRAVEGRFPPKPVHTEEYIREVYAAQDREHVRGAAPRYWEDVTVGEQLIPVVRGPHTLMDTVSWVIGGIGEFYFCSNRLYRFINEHTGWGTYDSDLKIYRNFHEDILDAYRSVGPMGSLRTSWLDMVLTNWMGDDGFLWKLNTSHTGIGMYGHVYWCRAEVVKKYNEMGRYCIDLNCWIEDHKENIVTNGKATVLLPSRQEGPVNYPLPVPVS